MPPSAGTARMRQPEKTAVVAISAVENVGAGFGNHLLAGLRVQPDRDLVAHGARGHKQRRFAAKELRRAPLQQIHGRVFAVNVVAHLSRRHRRAHLEPLAASLYPNADRSFLPKDCLPCISKLDASSLNTQPQRAGKVF